MSRAGILTIRTAPSVVAWFIIANGIGRGKSASWAGSGTGGKVSSSGMDGLQQTDVGRVEVVVNGAADVAIGDDDGGDPLLAQVAVAGPDQLHDSELVMGPVDAGAARVADNLDQVADLHALAR